ncbi:MAG: M20/M25/M40 family metallo-hydrolase, partial [Chloroflexota bacterium]
MLRYIKQIGLGVLAIVVVLVAVILVKTLTFASKQVVVSSQVSYPIDMDQAAARLGKALQLQTVSDTTEGQSVDWSQFTQFQQYLEKSFPLVHSTLDKKVINNCGLLYVWKGSDPQKKPIFLTGHYDVKPASDADAGWKYPPFSGVVSDGYIWGRGAVDDKATPMGLMEATEYLIKNDYKPTRSIYMGFGCDEENGGALGAAKMAEYLKSTGVQFEVIIDEGGFVTRGLIPGIPESQWVALVGTGEKGVVYLELTAETPGGHSSVPERWTSVGILAAALDKIESNPFPTRWPTPTQDTFDYLGPEMSYPNKLI